MLQMKCITQITSNNNPQVHLKQPINYLKQMSMDISCSCASKLQLIGRLGFAMLPGVLLCIKKQQQAMHKDY